MKSRNSSSAFCVTNVTKSFLRDQRGSVATAMCLMVVPVILSVGLAIDSYRMIDSRQMMQDLVDDAAVAGAVAYTDTSQTAKAKDSATNYFNRQAAQLPSWMTVTLTAVTPDPSDEPGSTYAVQVDGKAKINLYFGNAFARLLGGGSAVNNINISTTGKAANPILTINFQPINEGIATDDWDSVYIFPLARDSGNNLVYNYPQSMSVPTPADAQLIFTNCHASIQQGDGFYLPSMVGPIQTRCSYNHGIDLTPISNNSISFSSTRDFAFMLKDMTSGNEADPQLDSNWKQVSDYYYGLGCPSSSSACMNHTYPTIPQSPPNIFTYPYGYIGQYGEFWGTYHYFYSTFSSINKPPSENTSAIDALTPYPTWYNKSEDNSQQLFKLPPYMASATDTVPTTTDSKLVPVLPDWNTAPNVQRHYYYPENCSLQVSIVNPSALPGSPPKGTGSCFVTGSATTDPAYNYGTLNCAKLNGKTAMYWWNDMGDLGLDTTTGTQVIGDSRKYTDAEYIISCSGNNHNMVYLYK